MSEFNSFEGCKPTMSFMPAYEDINEAVFYMAASADREYAKLESAFNMAEILGESYLVEETGIKGWFENIIKWVKEQFNKLAGLFQKAIKTIQDKTLEFSNKVKNKIKDKTKVSEKLKNLKGGDKVYGKTFTNTWAQTESEVEKIETALNKLETNTRSLVSNYENYSTNKSVGEKLAKDSNQELTNMVGWFNVPGKSGSDYIKVSGGSATVDTSKLSEDLVKIILGDEKELKREDLISGFEEMWTRTTDYRKNVVELQRSFKKHKKYYDDTIKALKGAASADAKSGGFSKSGSMYTIIGKAVKVSKTINNTVGGSTIKALNKRIAKEQAIVWRAVIAATTSRDNAKSTEKAQEKLKASQELGESYTIDEVTDQLFDFS